MSDAGFLWVASAVVAVLVVIVALLRSRRGGGPMVEQTRAAPKVRGSLDAAGGRAVNVELGRELLPLLEQGRADEAVALVRERTGWGEEQARASVVRLESLRKRLES